MKRTFNDTDVKSTIENKSQNYARESGLPIDKLENSIASANQNELEGSSVNEGHKCNDDIGKSNSRMLSSTIFIASNEKLAFDV